MAYYKTRHDHETSAAPAPVHLALQTQHNDQHDLIKESPNDTLLWLWMCTGSGSGKHINAMLCILIINKR